VGRIEKMTQKPQWMLDEEALLAKENAYLNDYNWFEKLVDNHWSYMFSLVISYPFWILVGFLIGKLL
jgi:hypothetical protein